MRHVFASAPLHLPGITAAVLLCFLPAGCERSTDTRRENEITRLEQQVHQEQQTAEAALRRGQQAEAEARTWQTAAVCAGASAVLMLIIGTALGAKAREDADTPRTGSPIPPQTETNPPGDGGDTDHA